MRLPAAAEAGRSSVPPRVRIRERVEGEKRDVNTTAAAEHEAEHACIPKTRRGTAMRQEDALARRPLKTRPRAHRRSLLFLFVVQRRRSRDPFPADRNVKLLRARGTGRTVTAGDRAGGPEEIIRQTCINPSRFKYFPAR